MSVWKPHNPIEFHIGHAWFLSFLRAANEMEDTSLKVIIAPPFGLTKMPHEQVSENANITKQFIRECLEQNDVTESDVTIVTDETVDRVAFDNFKKAYFTLRSSQTTEIQNFIAEREWTQKPEFPAFLASAILSQSTSYIISGEKNKEVWWFFEQLFKYAERPFPKLLYVVSLLTYALTANPPVDGTALPMLMPMTSKSIPRVPLLEQSIEPKQTVTAFIGMAPELAIQKLCDLIGKPETTDKDTLADSLVQIIRPISAVLIRVAAAAQNRIFAERINNKTILQQMYDEEILSDPGLIYLIEEARNDQRGDINKEPAKYRETYRLCLDHMTKRIFRAPGAEGGEVRTLIEHSKLIDPLLFLANKRYRDHYMHQLDVALLGAFLLRCEVQEGKTLSEYIVEKNSYIKCENELYDAWWTAALLHDHAYPLAFLSQALQDIRILALVTGASEFQSVGDAFINYIGSMIAGQIRDVFKEFTRWDTQNNDNVKQALTSYRGMVDDMAGIVSQDKREKTYADFDTKVKRDVFDHGVLSALNLFLKTKELMRSPSSNVQATGRSCMAAVQAIAVHNLRDLQVPVSKFPLAALLCLCDELQEWGRQFKTKDGWDYAIDALVLELEHGKQGVRRFPDELSVEFLCSGIEARKITDWDYRSFESGKSAGLKKILFDWGEEFKPRRISFSVRIPVD